MHEPERDDGITLADLLAAFSLATDLGLGQPMEHVLRSWRIATRLGEHLDLEGDDRASLYYIAVLAWVGCVADTPEVARWFGDDIAFRGDSYQVELAGLPGLAFMLRHAGAGESALHRLRLASTLVATGGKGIERGLLSHCLTTSTMADRLGMGPDVSGPLTQFFTRWDGTGMPSGVGHEDIAPLVRLFHLADVVEVINRTDGLAAAVDVARARRGSHFDPAVVDAFCATAAQVLDDDADDRDWDEVISADPALRHQLNGAELDAALEVVADFTDLRSTWRAGHSRGVAELAAQAAVLAGLAGGRRDRGPQGRAAPRCRPSRCAGHDPGQARALDGDRVRAHAHALLLHGAGARATRRAGSARCHRDAHA